MDGNDRAVKNLSRRGAEFVGFFYKVLTHIETYTVPQYGDEPHDQVEAWSAEDCVKAIAKYCARFGSNARGEKEQQRDLLKIAHYAGLAYKKMEKK
ncbi:MAG: hypothetical protein WCQ99_02330 [Pseudomonadota bacterium]